MRQDFVVLPVDTEGFSTQTSAEEFARENGGKVYALASLHSQGKYLQFIENLDNTLTEGEVDSTLTGAALLKRMEELSQNSRGEGNGWRRLLKRAAAEMRFLRQTLTLFQILAKRYAEGRMTSVSDDVNEATRKLIKLDVPLNPGAEGTVFAADGMQSCRESEEHFIPWHPIALGNLIGLPRGTRLSEELMRLLDVKETDVYSAVKKIQDLIQLVAQLTEENEILREKCNGN